MSQPRIVITAGEPAGIGPDVVLRALQSELAAKIAVITDINVLQDRADLLGLSCYIDHLEKPEDVLPHAPGRVQVLHTPCAQDVVPGTLNATNAPHVISTLTMAAELTLDGLYDAVVTAPVQKSIINDSGIPFSGHTEFFADFFDGHMGTYEACQIDTIQEVEKMMPLGMKLVNSRRLSVTLSDPGYELIFKKSK